MFPQRMGETDREKQIQEIFGSKISGTEKSGLNLLNRENNNDYCTLKKEDETEKEFVEHSE